MNRYMGLSLHQCIDERRVVVAVIGDENRQSEITADFLNSGQ